MRVLVIAVFASVVAGGISTSFVRAADPRADAFFEEKVRPVLVEHCYRCHDETRQEPKGGLRVDGRAYLLRGGDTGPAVVPRKPAESLLIEAVKYKNVDLTMPPKGQLPDAAIADLERWIELGAPWPGDAASTPSPTVKPFDLAGRKAEHWAWRPVRRPALPAVQAAEWPTDPADRFILARLEAAGLNPAGPADRLTWLRRVTFDLIGLPPTPDEIAAFTADADPAAFERVVDRLLASPHFGERWGRHWLDVVRYAESRGHEFDPDIANAWQYRDYVVRAMNADVPYDRFVREHLAGDVLPAPRINPADGANESVLGTGYWHLGEEVHSPVDIRQDQADRLDNRIDVMSKAFLALTVSCARCHDHKFDAISTKDYYALFGLLEGSSYRQVRFDGWERNRTVAEQLKRLRDTFAAAVGAIRPRTEQPDAHPGDTARPAESRVVVDYGALKPGEFLPDDVTFGDGPVTAGSARLVDGQVRVEPRTAAVFDTFWAGLQRADDTHGTFGSLGTTERAGFTIRSPNFVIDQPNLYYLVRGGGRAYAAVGGHTVIKGPLHGSLVQSFADAEEYRWVRQSVAAYRGQRAHVELTADPKTPFAVAMIVQADEPPPIPSPPAVEGRVDAENVRRLAGQYASEERTLASRVVWKSRLAPALLDGTAVNDAVFVRGNPKTLGDVVPHRSLEALAGSEPLAHARGSGRYELAVQLTAPERNPFISRVMVNRIWHHLFGRGIVASPDNFGVLGEPPTHPELLDYLASEFVADGWSTKRMVRRLALSRAYRMSSSGPSPEVDADNLLLHKFRVRRLEGEAIRDAILSVSGRLDPSVGGPPVPVHLDDFLQGRGRPESGPLDGDGRRSLYLAVRRNFLSPLLTAFDTPIPFSTVGRRQVSNVPAQALVLMNDPFVHEQARRWGERLARDPRPVAVRVGEVYLAAFCRTPTAAETSTCRDYLADRTGDPAAWADLTHALVNVKEFVFIR